MSKLYYNEHILKVVKTGKYKGYNWLMTSCGSHPCCYVEIPQNNRLFNQDCYESDLENIDCHGGITFSDFRDFGFGSFYYIGWDYAHYGDHYARMFGDLIPELTPGKKWTIKEIEQEAKNVIKQIIEINK
jgi:hypothetical protein